MNRNTTILVIDDEENYLFILKELLTEEGYTVSTCNDSSLALLLLEKEAFDIVITDVKMPKFSGKDIAEHVHVLYPDTPIIVITAFGSIENAISFMKEGVFHYLTKPFENDELLRTVHNASELVFARKQYKDLYNQVHNKTQEQHNIIAHSKIMKPILDLMNSIQDTKTHILIEGESGTGKNFLARCIHIQSPYAKKALHEVDASVNHNILEETLFGTKENKGLLYQQDDTIILSSIDSMPYSVQVQLAEWLMKSSKEKEAIPRIIGIATNSLEEAVKNGAYSSDLYYSLASFHFRMPALRERRDDIPYLTVELMKHIAQQEDVAPKTLTPEVIQYLTNYEWYGNIKELQSVIKHILLVTQEESIQIHHLPSALQEEHTRFTSAVDLLPISLNLADTLEKIEEQLIRRALVHCNFVQARAAALLGISKSRLQYKLMKYEISGHQLHY